MSGTGSGAEDEPTIQPETELSHPDYERAGKKYRNIKTGLFAGKAEVRAAIEVSKAAAEAKAKADKMSENFHKIRLPKWDTEDPELWFQLCEDTFTIAQCEDQKVQAILVQRELPQSVTATVRQYITKPNDSSRYADLKKAILAQHKLSPREAWVKIGAMTLGDQKPSQLGQAMLAAIPTACGDDKKVGGCAHKQWIMDNLFDQKLPQAVKNGLAGTELDVKDPTNYFAQADRLMASVRAKQQAVHEVTKDGEVDAVGNRGGGKAGGNKKKETTRPKDVCFNHFRYKQKAWTCNAPTSCKYAKNVTPKPEPAKKDQKE